MLDASTTSTNMSPLLLKVVERAKREPAGRVHSLAHLIDVPALAGAYNRMRSDAAVGVDGVDKQAYGRRLEEHLQNLHARLVNKRYRHQPIRRVHIPKANGKMRPIGISAFEDKLVQDAVREVLDAVYEQDFMDCSYGFRPGRSAHDAVRRLDHIVHRGEVNWILEADIVSFCLPDRGDRQLRDLAVSSATLVRLRARRGDVREIRKATAVAAVAGQLLDQLAVGRVFAVATVPLAKWPFMSRSSRLADRILANVPSMGGSRTHEGSVLGGLGQLLDGD